MIGAINDITAEQRIKRLERRIVEMQELIDQLGGNNRREVLTWTPKGGDWFVNILGRVMDRVDSFTRRDAIQAIEFGITRPTKYQAEKAAESMRVHNRLLAYRDEFDPGYKWTHHEENTFICYDMDEKRYRCNTNCFSYMPDGVYMSKRVADELVEKLNNGSVVL